MFPVFSQRLIAIFVVLAAICAFASPASAFSIELKGAAPDRIERQRAAIRGQLPLPGTPDLASLDQRLNAKGLKRGSAVFFRVFKKTSELELWMEKDGRFILFATYPMCHWDGQLGPKLREGDRQSPEGFYTVTRRQMRPSRRWPKHFNLGFPNAYDRAHRRTGSYLLIHGGCTSIGCFALTDDVIDEVYGLAKAALTSGQPRFHVHVLPFRMTDANLARERNALWRPFWQDLKRVSDIFEQTKRPPRVAVCRKRYVGVPAADLKEASRAVASYCPKLHEPAAPQLVAAIAPPLPVKATVVAAAPKTVAVASKPKPPVTSTRSSNRVVVLNDVARRSSRSQPRKPRRRISRETRMSLGVSSCNPGLASCRKFRAMRRARVSAGRAAVRRSTRVRKRTTRRVIKRRVRTRRKVRRRSRRLKKSSAAQGAIKPIAGSFVPKGFQS